MIKEFVNKTTVILPKAVICLTAVAVIAGCSSLVKKPALTGQQRQLNIESFEYIWTTIRDKHYDPELGGLDWQAVHDELRPGIEKAVTMSESREIMSNMISRLELTHFAIIPVEVYEKMNGPAVIGAAGGVTGIDVRVIDGHALVTVVDKDSPAEKAGVKTGWEMVKIGKINVEKGLRPVLKEYEGRNSKDFTLAYTVKAWLRGNIGDTVSVVFIDGDNKKITLDIPLVEKAGKRYQFGEIPVTYVRIDTKTIDETIGCITLNVFMDPVNMMTAFNKTMKKFMNYDGIILDLRGNPGGMGAMAIGMGGWLVSEKGKYFGTAYFRDSELKMIVNPRGTVYTGPVAILIDGLSMSCSEFLSGGLKDIGRARIFGTRTPGAALPSTVEKLPNGDGFQYAFANYVSAGGDTLEGTGVIPDVEVRHTREALLEGRDLILESAIDWIRNKR